MSVIAWIGAHVVQLKTITGLVRRDLVYYGDYLNEAIDLSEERRLQWINWRARLLRQDMRAERAGLTPAGAPYYVYRDRETRRAHYFNSLPRAYLYQGGLRHRGRSLASSYALDQVSYADGDLILDCGANYADLKVFFDHDVEAKVDYIGIEPGRDEFYCMTRNCTMGTFTLLDCALGPEDSTATFFYSPEGANSSLDRPIDAVVGEYEVTVRSLDSLLDDEPFRGRRVRVLKLEAEGTEWDILRGATDSLQRIDYISADMGFERGVEAGSPAPEIIPFLLGQGFEIQAIGDPTSLRFLFRNTTAPAR